MKTFEAKSDYAGRQDSMPPFDESDVKDVEYEKVENE